MRDRPSALGDAHPHLWSLREELQAEGVVFQSETDTEVIPHLTQFTDEASP
jgi:glucosamine 6-phosphate synthetase-like amidotransferase/phosphosugar isomerase protein